MPIYQGETQKTLLKGDYRPAEFYKGSKKITGYDVQAVSGAEIAIENTYNDKLAPTVRGNGKQDGQPVPSNPVYPAFSEGKLYSEGRNLLPYKFESDTQTSFGITATKNADGSITIQGVNDGTGASSIYLARNNLGLHLPAGTYTLGAGTLPNGVSFYITPGYKSGTFTLQEATDFTIAYFNISPNTDLSTGITVYPQLERGSHRPYLSALPRPNLHYSPRPSGAPRRKRRRFGEGQPYPCGRDAGVVRPQERGRDIGAQWDGELEDPFRPMQ